MIHIVDRIPRCFVLIRPQSCRPEQRLGSIGSVIQDRHTRFLACGFVIHRSKHIRQDIGLRSDDIEGTVFVVWINRTQFNRVGFFQFQVRPFANLEIFFGGL